MRSVRVCSTNVFALYKRVGDTTGAVKYQCNDIQLIVGLAKTACVTSYYYY